MDRVVRDHYDAVYRFCARRVGAARAADAAQDTFLTAQRAIRRFRGESCLRTWLLGIALNECRRTIRRHGADPLPLAVDLACPAAEAEGTVVDRQALATALGRLSDEHRDVVILHELQGLTYEEVAAVLKIPVGTVKSRLHHAFVRLRRELL
jgi:RNA polymerase sigma-70 factor (ECF subfamily)